MPLVQVTGLKKSFQQGKIAVEALKGVDLNIERGEFTAIAGPSGSGKTTLLNHIGGLDQPTSGSVTIEETDLSQLSKSELSTLRLERIGFIFQSYNLIPVLSAQENVEFVMLLQGCSAEERGQKARAILKEVGLEGLENRRPFDLSGGQQQRVAVARAIVSEPSLIIADEPTANLDSQTAADLLNLMKKLNRDKEITFVFSTHDPQVMEASRRLIQLKDGQIEKDSEVQS